MGGGLNCAGAGPRCRVRVGVPESRERTSATLIFSIVNSSHIKNIFSSQKENFI